MARHQYSNSAFVKDGNHSDSFDMFTDSEGSDLEWHRASVDIQSLPSDTTTTDPVQNNAAMRSQMMQQMQQQSMSMVQLPQHQNRSAPKIVAQVNKKEKERKKKKSNKEANNNHAPHPKRAKTIMELISTEAIYVTQLKKLIKIYPKKLENSTKMITATDYNVIFPPTLKTIANLHEKLLQDIQQRYKTYSDDQRWILSDILTSFCPYLKMYTMYIKNVHAQLHTIRKCLDNVKLYAFHEKHKKQFNDMTLTDLMILPAQRLIEYKALIQAIIDQTNPQHPDSVGLQNIYKLISNIIIQHNEILYDLEARVKILNICNEIQSVPDLTSSVARQFIFSQELYTIKPNGKTSKYMFYLFNDCLLYALVAKHGAKCVFKMRIPIDSAFAVQNIDDLKKYKNIFAIYSSLESFIVTTKNNTELKTKWLQVLNKVIHDAKHRNYFHIDTDTARVGRGSILISQAALQIPKHVQKQLNKEHKSIPVTKSNNITNKHVQHPPVPQMAPPPPPIAPPTKTTAPQDTVFEANNMGANRRRSSFGGCTTDKSAHEYYKTPFHHVPVAKHTLNIKANTKVSHTSSKSNPSIVDSDTALVTQHDIHIDRGNLAQHNMMKQLQQTSISMRKIASPQSDVQRSEIIQQMQQQSMSVQSLSKTAKKPHQRKVFRKSGKKPPAKKKISEREDMMQQLQQTSVSMQKIQSPQNEAQREDIIKQMQLQSMSERAVTQSKTQKKVFRKPHTDKKKVFRKPHTDKKKALPPRPPSKALPQKKTLPKVIPKHVQSKSAMLQIKKPDKTKQNDTIMKPKVRPQANVNKGGISDLVSRFNKEDEVKTESSSSKANIDLSKMAIKTSSRNILSNKSYEQYKTDTESKKIWNAYLNQHGEEPKNEWALHGFIKAQPQLPAKTFRQARGIFRAFKGT